MLLILGISIAPVAFLLAYIYNRDVLVKESTKNLAKAFFGGVLSTLLVIIPLTLFGTEADSWEDPVLSAFGSGVLEAGVPEELMKFLILYYLIWKNSEFNEYFDGIVYAVFVSMGFACLENIMYVFENGVGTGLMRAFTAVPGHFFFAVIMGYYFSLAKFNVTGRAINMIKAITVPMIVHGAYDMIIILGCRLIGDEENEGYPFIALLLFIFFIIFNAFMWKKGFKRIQEMRQRDIDSIPAEEQVKIKN